MGSFPLPSMCRNGFILGFPSAITLVGNTHPPPLKCELGFRPAENLQNRKGGGVFHDQKMDPENGSKLAQNVAPLAEAG